MSLPRQNKLSNRIEFQRLLGKSRSVHLDTASIYYMPRPDGLPSRVGTTLKLKTTSVFRSRIKRTIHGQFMDACRNLVSTDFNVVIHRGVLVDWKFVNRLGGDLHDFFAAQSKKA